MHCIYKITNKLNGKCYIGQTRNFTKRMQTHKANFTKKIYDTALYRAFEKYGFNNFDFEIIEQAISQNDIDNRERYYIEKYNTYYNGGYNETTGGNTNYGLSTATKSKLSIKVKKMWQDGVYKKRKHNITKALEVAHANASERTKKLWTDPEHKRMVANKISQKHSRPITAYNETKNISFKTYNDAIEYLKANGWPKASKSAISIAKKHKVMRYGYYWKV